MKGGDNRCAHKQLIPQGTKIAVNEVIHLKSSRGIRPEQSIPDVCGMEQEQAERVIRGAGCTPLPMWPNFTEEPYGIVFRMKECDDGNVLLYVSNGIGGKMPDLVGKVVNAAMPESIEELSPILHSNVQGTSIFDSNSDAPAGTVLSQYPAAGEPVWSQENVIVCISWPEPADDAFVSIPDLTGKTLSEAIGEIRFKGCEPIIGKNVYRPDLPDFTVIETEPGDLSHVRKGSGVRLIISVSNPQLADAE